MIIPSARRVSAGDTSTFAEFARIPDAPVGVGVYLWPLGRSIYVGHGEWTDNLGPTDVVSIGPTGNVIHHLKDVPTEALDCYRMIEGTIYAPYTDPRGRSGGYVTNEGGTWRMVTIDLPMVHCFDIGKTFYGLWMTGSARSVDGTTEPVVIRSTDGGVTWTEKYAGPRGQLNRFYGLWVEGDTVFVREPTGAVISTRSGEVWTQVNRPDLHTPLSFSGYTTPDYVRNPTPTVEEQRRLDWSDAVERPAGTGRYPVFMDGFAYIGKPDGDGGIIIYRRPAYLDRPQNN